MSTLITTNGNITNVNTGTIKDSTGNTTAMTIDSSGRVLTPTRPAFCTSGTNYTQGSGLSIIIPHTVDVNIGNHMNGSTGVFTAPVAGLYMFGFWGLSYPHGTAVNHIAYYKNGAQTFAKGYTQFNGTSTNHELCSGSAIYQLAVNDEITLRYNRTSGSSTAWQNQWTMHGHLIG